MNIELSHNLGQKPTFKQTTFAEKSRCSVKIITNIEDYADDESEKSAHGSAVRAPRVTIAGKCSG